MHFDSVRAFDHAFRAVAATNAPNVPRQIPETLPGFVEIAFEIVVGKEPKLVGDRHSLRAFAFALKAHPAIEFPNLFISSEQQLFVRRGELFRHGAEVYLEFLRRRRVILQAVFHSFPGALLSIRLLNAKAQRLKGSKKILESLPLRAKGNCGIPYCSAVVVRDAPRCSLESQRRGSIETGENGLSERQSRK